MEVEEEDKLHLAERLRSPPRSSFLHSAHNTIYHEGVCASLDLLSSRDALEELVGEKGFERRWRRESSLDNSGWQLSSPVSGASTPARRGGVGAGGTAAFPATRTPRTPRSARLRRAAGRRASSTLRKTYGPEGPAPRERPRRPSDAGSVTFLQFFSLLLAALAVIFAAAVGYGTWSFGAKRRACTLGVVQCPSGRERGREREGEEPRHLFLSPFRGLVCSALLCCPLLRADPRRCPLLCADDEEDDETHSRSRDDSTPPTAGADPNSRGDA